MQRLYTILINLSGVVLKSAGFFSKKIAEFTEGRQGLFEKLEKGIQNEVDYIWIHAASLGEFEQAVPVMKMLKKEFPQHKIVVSFFSPSGYNNKKQHPLVDVITYLPLDTPKNVRKYLDIIQPKLVIFIKYDFWPNFLKELKQRKIRTLLVSGIFREDHLFFKYYGKWMLEVLGTFEHFFVQNQESVRLLEGIGFNNVTLSGDTRFDRVESQLTYSNKLDFIESFKESKLLLVAGSTWPEDEDLILDFINSSPKDIKFLIAPHEIKEENIHNLEQKLKRKSIRYSKREGANLNLPQVFILDTIGLLNKAYSYADIAYVGGASGTTGLHNILEPAAFGIPIIIGKNYKKFPEAVALNRSAGLFSTKSKSEFKSILDKLITNHKFRRETGMITGHFIGSNTGATHILKEYLKS